MTVKPRSIDQTAISVSLPAVLLEEIDSRARALGLNRSQYLCQLAREDLTSRGAMTLYEAPVSYAVPRKRKQVPGKKVGPPGN